MKTIKYILILLATMLLSWGLPSLYHLVADKSGKNIFTYYSSVEKSFCAIKYDEKDGLIRYNLRTGKEYSEAEFDSILPMFYARQLMSDGRFPDSINGQPITIKEVNNKTFYYRYNPKDKNSPSIPIYTLFESFSGRVKLEMPGDVFRLKNNIEFIDPETNTVNVEKSQRFNNELIHAGFSFPAKQAFGNPTTRKIYDEGYFVIDAQNQVFHLKMVNAKPFVKNIKIPSNIIPIYIAIREPKDKSNYGFLFDSKYRLYVITTDNYKLEEIKTPAFNSNADKLIVMANPLYWTVNVLSAKGKECQALNANNKEIVDSISLHRDWEEDMILSYVFPFELTFTSSSSDYIKPNVEFAKAWVLIFNVLLAAIFWFIVRKRQNKNSLISSVWIGLTGIFGFITCLVLNE